MKKSFGKKKEKEMINLIRISKCTVSFIISLHERKLTYTLRFTISRFYCKTNTVRKVA